MELICNDRDPPWINKDIKQLILNKNHAYKSYIRNELSLEFFNQFQFNKLLDPKTSQKKSCWSVLKTFLNNKKISCISPLVH